MFTGHRLSPISHIRQWKYHPYISASIATLGELVDTLTLLDLVKSILSLNVLSSNRVQLKGRLAGREL